MHKVIKKLYVPSYPVNMVKAASGGGGGLTALYTSSAFTGDDTGNQNNSFRVAVPITGSTGTQIRATIRPGTTDSLTVLHASIGKRNTLWNTTATPLELKFGGVSGFTGATTDQVSDWTNLSGLSMTTGDDAVVIYDLTTGSSTASQRLNNAATGCVTYYKDGIQSWNDAAPVTMNTVSGDVNYCIVSVETQ